MAATLHDVSRLAGVSVKTVSNVINDYPHVRPATRQRVLDAIAELGYTPNLSARSLRSGRSHVISLVIPELRNAYFGELADAVMRAARQRGLSVLIEQFGNDRESELAVLQTAQRQMVDGMIYSVLALEESDRAAIADIRMPVVLLGDRLFEGPRDHVAMQNAEASRAATEHLIAQGARRIVALGEHRGEVIGSAGLRLRGYREAFEGAGIPYDPDLVLPAGTWHRRDGAEAMRAFLDRSHDFDGVVAFNDTLAFGAMRVIEETGLRVPDDVLMIGFDDLDETRYSIPTLSSINPGREEIASVAVDLLCARIESAAASDDVREIAVPFELMQRESSGGAH